MYDIIIIGAGPAGLTAAVYACRAGKSVLILEKESFGGQMTQSPKIENYPGFRETSGNELADKMVDQVLALGAEIEVDKVIAVRKEPKCMAVATENAEYFSKAIIVAAGCRHRMLDVEREEELIGSGVSYCSLCDGAFYAGKDVAVIGGGNSALQDAILLAGICRKVTVVQNLSELTGEACLAKTAQAFENVEFIYDSVVAELEADSALKAIIVENTQTKIRTRIPVDGVFIAIGQIPENEPFDSVCFVGENGYIESDESCMTCTPGIFAAGDCRTKRVRQIVTAVADGSVAALAACAWIDRKDKEEK